MRTVSALEAFRLARAANYRNDVLEEPEVKHMHPREPRVRQVLVDACLKLVKAIDMSVRFIVRAKSSSGPTQL